MCACYSRMQVRVTSPDELLQTVRSTAECESNLSTDDFCQAGPPLAATITADKLQAIELHMISRAQVQHNTQLQTSATYC